MRCPVFFFLLFLVVPLTAQDEQPLETTYTIPSAAFGDDRQITVYLPPNYYERPDEKYTITYVLDGHYDPFIDLVVKTIEYNTNTRNYLPTIVVGIHAKSRGWEFSLPVPGDKDDEEYEGGRAPELQRHLQEEVIPFVEKLFPTARDFKTLIGHSSGGTFVLHTVFSEKSAIFDAYIAISAALRPGEQQVVEAAAARLRAGATFPRFLYSSAGTVGEREELFGAGLHRVDSLLKAHPGHGLLWHPEVFSGQDHFTVVAPSVNGGLLALSRAFRVDASVFTDLINEETPDLIGWVENFYAVRENEYGFSDYLPASAITSIVRHLGSKQQFRAAHDIADWGLRKYPEAFWLSNARALLYEEEGDLPAARKAYRNTLVLLERIKEELEEERYLQRRTQLENRLKQLD